MPKFHHYGKPMRWCESKAANSWRAGFYSFVL